MRAREAIARTHLTPIERLLLAVLADHNREQFNPSLSVLAVNLYGHADRRTREETRQVLKRLEDKGEISREYQQRDTGADDYTRIWLSDEDGFDGNLPSLGDGNLPSIDGSTPSSDGNLPSSDGSTPGPKTNRPRKERKTKVEDQAPSGEKQVKQEQSMDDLIKTYGRGKVIEAQNMIGGKNRENPKFVARYLRGATLRAVV